MDDLTPLERELLDSVKQLIAASDERNSQQQTENAQLMKMFQEQQEALKALEKQVRSLKNQLIAL